MWGWVLGGLAALIALTAIGSVVVLRVLFRRSPVGRWRAGVHSRYEDGSRTLERLLSEQRDVPKALERCKREMESSAFARYLTSIPVSVLESFSGIGPVTTSRIEGAGYRSLADLRRNPNVRAPGLGEKRLADVSAALRVAVDEAWTRLLAGGCGEGQELSRQLMALRAASTEREQGLLMEIDACRAFLSELQPFMAAAQHMTLWRYVRDQQSLLASDWLTRPVPDLKVRLCKAGQSTAEKATIPAKAPTDGDVATPVELFRKEIVPARGTNSAKQRLDGPPPVARPAPPHDDLESFVQFAYAVARADGRVAKREKNVIAEFVANRCGGDAAQLNRANGYCAYYESASIDLERCLQSISMGRSSSECRELYAFAEAIADAAGPRNEREIDFLRRVAWAFGIQEAEGATGPPTIESLPPLRGCNQRLAILEIDPAATLSADLVRRQYNLLTERFAPEKFASAGADFTAMAEAKRSVVRAAALALLEPFGETLEQAAPAAQELRHNPDLDAMFSVP